MPYDSLITRTDVQALIPEQVSQAMLTSLQRRSVEAQAEAAAASRQLVAELRASGLTVRDVAAVVGISPQRVSQLAR